MKDDEQVRRETSPETPQAKPPRPETERHPAPEVEHAPEPDAGNVMPATDRPGTL